MPTPDEYAAREGHLILIYSGGYYRYEDPDVERCAVTDEQGRLVGIVSMADLTRALDAQKMGHTLEEVSETDTRQLYSEVHEGGRSGLQVAADADPRKKLNVAS